MAGLGLGQFGESCRFVDRVADHGVLRPGGCADLPGERASRRHPDTESAVGQLIQQRVAKVPSRTERGYITSWLDMGFGCDAIAEAYDRTVVATGARKWAYLNRILMSWHEKGLHTPEEIETGDPRAAGKRRAANPAAPAADRDDLDRVEQMLRKMEQTNT